MKPTLVGGLVKMQINNTGSLSFAKVNEYVYIGYKAWQYWPETYEYSMTFHPIFGNHREKIRCRLLYNFLSECKNIQFLSSLVVNSLSLEI